jgi:hypothetical protein
VVTLSNTAESLAIAYNYSKPVITNVTPNPVNARGGTILLFGNDFGIVGVGHRPVVHLNGTLHARTAPPLCSFCCCFMACEFSQGLFQLARQGFGWHAQLFCFPLFVCIKTGRLCTEARLLQARDTEQDDRPYIECKAQDDITGRKNVTVSTGYFTVRFDTRQSQLSSVCPSNFFGNVSEYCEPCYSGAACDGGLMEPRSLPGFFIGNLSLEARSDGCQPRHTTRRRCLAPRPCDPPESCIGDDLCSRAYTSVAPLYRCATCADGYYRLAGKCRKCPDNPWILIVTFVVIVLAAAVVGYVLNRKSVNVAFLSIGIDYFQVLAMFSRSNVKWPSRTLPNLCVCTFVGFPVQFLLRCRTADRFAVSR